MPLIETNRLVIREFTMEDLSDLHEILGDAETMKYSEPPYDPAKTQAFLRSFCIDRHGALAAWEKRAQKVIGYILFSGAQSGVYEMGWFFNRSFWRQGYACEACKAVIEYAFQDRNANKIFAETIDGVKSIGLMRKLGMTQEGIRRSQVRGPDGHWADLYLYGLLREQWKKLH